MQLSLKKPQIPIILLFEKTKIIVNKIIYKIKLVIIRFYK